MTVLYPNPCYNKMCYKGMHACMVFFRFLADFSFFFISNYNFRSCWISSKSYKYTVLDRGCRGFQTFYGLFLIFFVQSSVSCPLS